MVFKGTTVCRRSRMVKGLFTVTAFLLSLSFMSSVFLTEPAIRSNSGDLPILMERTQFRREYYFLNDGFLEFLRRSSISCHIRVEPGEKWQSQALVTNKLYDRNSSHNNPYKHQDNGDYSSKSYRSTVDAEDSETDGETTGKYILAYRHFEQLGKTIENFIQLAALAKHWGRQLVVPGIRNSRMSLEPNSNAYPMDTYFNVEKFNRLLNDNGYAKLVRPKSFLDGCRYTDTHQVKTTLVHFLYNGYYKGNTRLWYGISQKRLDVIINESLATGCTPCDFIDEKLNISKVFNGITVGRQLCVNPEVITSETIFDNVVLRDAQCVIFVEWRGLGRARTHFRLKFRPFLPPRQLKHALSISDLIEREVANFKKIQLPTPYISVHLRAEKVLDDRTFQNLQVCVDHLVYIVRILRELRGIASVFLATDLTRFGSDAFDRLKYYKANVTGRYRVGRAELARLHESLATRLRAITYSPTRTPFRTDKGMVSLVEMNILKGGEDLVSVGGGTFHAWMVAKFEEEQSQRNLRGYTLTEICFDEKT